MEEAHFKLQTRWEQSLGVLIENCQSERKRWVVFVKQSECQQRQRCCIVVPVLASGYTSVRDCCCQQRSGGWVWVLFLMMGRLIDSIKQRYMHTSDAAVGEGSVELKKRCCLGSHLRVSDFSSVENNLNCPELVKTGHVPGITYSAINLAICVDYTWRQKMIYFLITDLEKLNIMLCMQCGWLFWKHLCCGQLRYRKATAKEKMYCAFSVDDIQNMRIPREQN